MKPSRHLWRGLLEILVILPFWTVAIVILWNLSLWPISSFTPYYSGWGILPAIITPIALFVVCATWYGARWVKKSAFTQSSDSIFVRYAPVIIASTYTLIAALICALLAPEHDGESPMRFASIFTALHFFSPTLLALRFLLGATESFYYLALPLTLAAAYWLGMLYGYRERPITPQNFFRGTAIMLSIIAALGGFIWIHAEPILHFGGISFRIGLP